MIFEFLYIIFIQPLELLMACIYAQCFIQTNSHGISIVMLSLIVNLALLPSYLVSDKWMKIDQIKRNKLQKKLNEIKLAFRGQERFAMTQMLYKTNNYHPLKSLRTSLGILIQLPFFIAAYQFILNNPSLVNIPFLFFEDLSKPDALINIGRWDINLMPLLMTLIGIISSYVFLLNQHTKDRFQIYSLPVIFLGILYFMPVGMVLYWTMSNLFSLTKNVITLHRN